MELPRLSNIPKRYQGLLIFKFDIPVSLAKCFSLFVTKVIPFSMAIPVMSKSMLSTIFPVRFSFPYSAAEISTDGSFFLPLYNL